MHPFNFISSIFFQNDRFPIPRCPFSIDDDAQLHSFVIVNCSPRNSLDPCLHDSTLLLLCFGLPFQQECLCCKCITIEHGDQLHWWTNMWQYIRFFEKQYSLHGLGVPIYIAFFHAIEARCFILLYHCWRRSCSSKCGWRRWPCRFILPVRT